MTQGKSSHKEVSGAQEDSSLRQRETSISCEGHGKGGTGDRGRGAQGAGRGSSPSAASQSCPQISTQAELTPSVTTTPNVGGVPGPW